MQLSGHRWLLHCWYSEVGGQAIPPCLGWRATVRERDWTTPSQTAVQVDQGSNIVTMQSIGAGVGWGVGGAVGAEVGASVGASVGAVVGVKVGTGVGACVGTGVGQTNALQSSCRTNSGHGVPPWAGWTAILRQRPRMPPPHDLVQTLQAPKLDTLQSMGQASVLHVLMTVVGGQVLPPFSGSRRMVRVPVIEPVPHGLSHVPQVSSSASQSTGQASEVHCSVSDNAGHTTSLHRNLPHG